jgi:uncharacterized protein YcbX
MDREFLVIDELLDGKFINARMHPKMILIETERVGQKLIVKFPTGRHVEVDLDEVKRRNDVRIGR